MRQFTSYYVKTPSNISQDNLQVVDDLQYKLRYEDYDTVLKRNGINFLVVHIFSFKKISKCFSSKILFILT